MYAYPYLQLQRQKKIFVYTAHKDTWKRYKYQSLDFGNIFDD
jgi:hypothetical protein